MAVRRPKRRQGIVLSGGQEEVERVGPLVPQEECPRPQYQFTHAEALSNGNGAVHDPAGPKHEQDKSPNPPVLH